MHSVRPALNNFQHLHQLSSLLAFFWRGWGGETECLISHMEVRGVLFVGVFFSQLFCLCVYIYFFFFQIIKRKVKFPACLVSGPTLCATAAGDGETVLSCSRKTADCDIITLINPPRLPGPFFPQFFVFSRR